jgi:hypothetical protein
MRKFIMNQAMKLQYLHLEERLLKAEAPKTETPKASGYNS